jgi:hypothetical protein
VSRKRVVRTPQQSLSRAESAWLTGDAPDDLSKFEDYMLWSLRHGFPSFHRGRSITARELFAQYGDTVSESRRRELRREIAAMSDHDRRGQRAATATAQPQPETEAPDGE